MKEEKVFIQSTSIRLEGLINFDEALSFKGGAIFFHPHPQYGGDMYNPVIDTAVKVAAQSGFSTLRFNFRGVGESEGSYGEGIGEREDVGSAIEYFAHKLKNHDIHLILVGYSFGSWMSLNNFVNDIRVRGMVAIAPPLELYDFKILEGCKKKKLFIAGSKDTWCPRDLLEDWFWRLDEPKSLKIIEGADHFFFSHTHLLIEPLTEFFSSDF